MRILIIILIFFLSACSVSTAMKGQNPPDLSLVRVGADYNDVKNTVGHPIAVQILKTGERLYTYEYEGGRSPDATNFIMNLTLDLATLVTWEFMPSDNRANKQIHVTYDKQNKVASIDKYLLK